MTVPALHLPLDADLGDLLASGALGPPPKDITAFERSFVQHVEAGGPGAWDRFYDATLARVAAGPERGSGTVATFSRIWSLALTLQRGPSALDVGSCFGFFPLHWATRPDHPRLLALDLSDACASLAAQQAKRLRLPLDLVCADATRLPLPDRSIGTVTVLHVLEHLRVTDAALVLREALRVADRRVVVAVPVEAEPDPVFGHVQVFDLPRLASIGRRTGWWMSLLDADGAWLVLDRPHGSGAISSNPS